MVIVINNNNLHVVVASTLPPYSFHPLGLPLRSTNDASIPYVLNVGVLSNQNRPTTFNTSKDSLLTTCEVRVSPSPSPLFSTLPFQLFPFLLLPPLNFPPPFPYCLRSGLTKSICSFLLPCYGRFFPHPVFTRTV